MKKVFVTLVFTIILVSCRSSAPGNTIVIGSIREGVILESLKSYSMDEFGNRSSISIPFSNASEANWSPDNKWIVYQTQETAKQNDPKIFVITADGSKSFDLTDSIYKCGFAPSWSPEGNRIAAYFSCNTSELSGIYIVDVTCILTEEKCVFDYEFLVEGQNPTWSPDGSQLAFSTPDHEIYVISIDNPVNTQIISKEDVDCYSLEWSPIDNQIAMGCYAPKEGGYISLVDLDKNNLRTIANEASSPVWSPDGSKIAFISNRFGSKQIIYSGISSDAVYVMNNDGSSVTRISPYDNESIQWVDWINP